MLANAERIATALRAAQGAMIESEGSASDALGAAASALAGIARFGRDFEELATETGTLQSEVNEGIHRFVLLLARITVGALVLGLLGALALTVFIFMEAPQLSSWFPFQVGAPLLMGIAVILAGTALWYGIGALSVRSHVREGSRR